MVTTWKQFVGESVPVSCVVNYNSIRHDGSGATTPRRIRGHDGSATYRPKYGKARKIPGFKSTCRMKPESRLELLATMLLHSETASAAWQRITDSKRKNFIGGSGFTDTKSQRLKPVTLRDIVAQIDSSRTDSETMAESVACHLDNLSAGFGHYLLSVEAVAIAAKLAGISLRSAYRHIETVRESWQSSDDSAA